jgi:hypothetical protein
MLKLIIGIILGLATLGGVIWAWKEDYIDFDQIKSSLGLDGLKDMLITMLSEPTFLFLYALFVFFPVWILANWIHVYDIPLWQKIGLSVGGLFAVNWIMDAKGLK